MATRVVAAIVALLCLAGSAHATQVCGWIVEKNQRNKVHELDLYLQADGMDGSSLRGV